MIIEDFIMLGTTVPEPQKKTGRTFVCSAGYSHEMRSLIRIYPLAYVKCPRRWSVSRVALERNPQDSRNESWQLRGDRSPGAHRQINDVFEIIGKVERQERSSLMSGLCLPSIQEANNQRRSLCIIQPECIPKLTFKENPDSPDHPQLDLGVYTDGREPPAGAKRFAFQPYAEFRDAGGWHDLQVRDWGGYEFMRKHGVDRRHELAVGWRFGGRPCLLCGNMSNHRTSWLIISVLMPLQQLSLNLEAAE